MGAEEEVLTEEVAQEGGVEEYDGGKSYTAVGGKRRRGRKGSRRTKKGKKMKKGRKGTRKGKRPPSKWIMHVKAFCKKNRKKFPTSVKRSNVQKNFQTLDNF